MESPQGVPYYLRRISEVERRIVIRAVNSLVPFLTVFGGGEVGEGT